jgi:hypothetical protein
MPTRSLDLATAFGCEACGDELLVSIGSLMDACAEARAIGWEERKPGHWFCPECTSRIWNMSESRRDPDTNNPIWDLDLPVKVYRQDNSLSLVQHLGSLSNDDVVADIGIALGGLVVITLDYKKMRKGKKDGDTVRYAIDTRPLLEKVIELHPKFFEQAMRLPNRRKPAKKKRGKK